MFARTIFLLAKLQRGIITVPPQPALGLLRVYILFLVVKLKKFGDDDGENEVSIGVKMMSSYKSEMIFHKDSLPKRELSLNI